MKCNLCDQKTKSGIISAYAGLVCEDCKPAAREMREAAIEEAREYDFEDIPDEMNIGDFERFVFAYAVLVLDNEENRKMIADANPMFAVPEELSAFWKERLLDSVKTVIRTAGEKDPVVLTEARGHDRFFHGGTYRFREPVETRFVIEAAEGLGMIEPTGEVSDD